MKRAPRLLYLLFCLVLLCSCATTTPAGTAATLPSKTAAPLPTYAPPSFSAEDEMSVVHQYGETCALVSNEGEDQYMITYPQGEEAALTKALNEWAQGLILQFFSDPDRPASNRDELEVHYSSYVYRQRLIGVKESGQFISPYSAHPEPIAATFNFDRVERRLLSPGDLFAPGREDEALALLRRAVGDVAGRDWDADCTLSLDDFSHLVVTDKGIEVVLPAGELLPYSLGTKTLLLAYPQLNGLLSPELFAKASEPTPSAAPTPEPTPAKTPAPSVPAPRDGRPLLALTFDDGPSKNTERILDALQRVGGHATFCVVGNRVRSYKSVVKRAVDEGNEIASHTWEHANLTNLDEAGVRESIASSQKIVKDVSGARIRFLRPPYGAVDDTVKEVCRGLDMGIALWSVDTEDWKTKDAEATAAAIREAAKDGAIVLCHDLYDSTAEAMESLLPELAERYELVTLSELVERRRGEVSPGQVYRRIAP